jgi:hypothetical protein
VGSRVEVVVVSELLVPLQLFLIGAFTTVEVDRQCEVQYRALQIDAT